MKKGEIYIVSTGTGEKDNITHNAYNLLQKAELIVGYKKYIEDISALIEGKNTFATGMTQEVERCKYAVKQAMEAKKVAIISNGDANIYGMAGLVLEIIEENNLWENLEVVIEPGVTTLLATAAKTGAPIMNDFAVISLSNLLTPLETIELRLINALKADFVLGIYNPLSKTRKEPYIKFLEILSEHVKQDTPVIIAQNVGRNSETIMIKTASYLLGIRDDNDIINMSTIIIIGNSTTKTVNSGKMVVTTRGYQQSYNYIIDL